MIQSNQLTPLEYERAVWAAWAQLFIETDEAYAAIAAYEAEWSKAA